MNELEELRTILVDFRTVKTFDRFVDFLVDLYFQKLRLLEKIDEIKGVKYIQGSLSLILLILHAMGVDPYFYKGIKDGRERED